MSSAHFAILTIYDTYIEINIRKENQKEKQMNLKSRSLSEV